MEAALVYNLMMEMELHHFCHILQIVLNCTSIFI